MISENMTTRKKVHVFAFVVCFMIVAVIILRTQVNNESSILPLNVAKIYKDVVNQKAGVAEEKDILKEPSGDKEDTLTVRIPDKNVLQRMHLEAISELYHRYMNNLQVLCPVKDLFGGVETGYSLCAPLKQPKQRNCSAILISLGNETKKLPTALAEIKVDYGCAVQQIGVRKFMKYLQNKEANSSLVTKIPIIRSVDALIIDAADRSSLVLRQMLSAGLLRNVTQIVVHLHTTNDNTSPSEYIQQLLLMRHLYIEGFRIHTYERIFKCTYKVNIWRTGCYVLSMMRMVPVLPSIVIPSSKNLHNLSAAAVETLYHKYMISTQILCRDIVRVGHIEAGGWDVCNDTQYRPSSNCLVYSFGIAKDWTFDDEVTRRYGCEVHSFDPTIHLPDHQRSSKVYFHNLGLGGKDNKNNTRLPILTMKTIINSLGHQKRIIDILKVDIEFYEWPTLPNMFSTGVLRNVRQFHLETHHTNSGKSEYIKRLDVCRRLYEAGFRLYSSNPNRYRINHWFSGHTKRKLTSAYEIYFLNINAKS